MTLGDLLERLGGARHASRGWVARCPAHDDRRPSLAVAEADDRVLVHCRAGCDPGAVCAALGLTLADLYARPGRPSRRTPRRRLSPREWLRAAEQGLWCGAIEREYRALAVLDAARGCAVSGWTDEDRARAMAAVCRAYDDLIVAAHLHNLAGAWREQIHAWDARRRPAA